MKSEAELQDLWNRFLEKEPGYDDLCRVAQSVPGYAERAAGLLLGKGPTPHELHTLISGGQNHRVRELAAGWVLESQARSKSYHSVLLSIVEHVPECADEAAGRLLARRCGTDVLRTIVLHVPGRREEVARLVVSEYWDHVPLCFIVWCVAPVPDLRAFVAKRALDALVTEEDGIMRVGTLRDLVQFSPEARVEAGKRLLRDEMSLGVPPWVRRENLLRVLNSVPELSLRAARQLLQGCYYAKEDLLLLLLVAPELDEHVWKRLEPIVSYQDLVWIRDNVPNLRSKAEKLLDTPRHIVDEMIS